jgi:hypothetical protein
VATGGGDDPARQPGGTAPAMASGSIPEATVKRSVITPVPVLKANLAASALQPVRREAADLEEAL